MFVGNKLNIIPTTFFVNDSMELDQKKKDCCMVKSEMFSLSSRIRTQTVSMCFRCNGLEADVSNDADLLRVEDNKIYFQIKPFRLLAIRLRLA